MATRRRADPQRVLVYSLSMLVATLTYICLHLTTSLERSSSIRKICGTVVDSIKTEQDDVTETAVLISGQCSRFIYRDQLGPLFNTSSSTPFSVYIVLQCGEKNVQAFAGTFDKPPYMHTPNVTDIKEWFLHEKGAQKVEIKFLNDAAMEEGVKMIKTQVTKIHHTVKDNDGYNLTEMLLSHPKFWRWEIEFRKFYARHVVYQMAYPHGHRDFLYAREDNYYVNPLPLEDVKSILRREEHSKMLAASSYPDDKMPVVIVDEPCRFGSYSDKFYVANGLGADLLFGSNLAEFLEKMKRYVLFGFYLKDFDTFQPFQPEAYVHDSLSAATVMLYNMERVDVRYNNGIRCIQPLYYYCMPQSTIDLAIEQDLVVCDNK